MKISVFLTLVLLSWCIEHSLTVRRTTCRVSGSPGTRCRTSTSGSRVTSSRPTTTMQKWSTKRTTSSSQGGGQSTKRTTRKPLPKKRKTTQRTLQPKKVTTRRMTARPHNIDDKEDEARPENLDKPTTEENKPVHSSPEEQDDVTKETKTNLFLQRNRNELKKAAKWFTENKDKRIDDILVEKWSQKCSKQSLDSSNEKCMSNANSSSVKRNCKNDQVSKKKSCIESGLAEEPGDTEEIKGVKSELKAFLIEDPEKGFGIVIELITKASDEASSESVDGEDRHPGDEQDSTESEADETEQDGGEEDPEDSSSYFESFWKKQKNDLKKAAKWFNENKGKSIDDIMVDRWSKKCADQSLKSSERKCLEKATSPSAKSKCKKDTANTKKSCIESGLAEQAEDTEEVKEVKNELKIFFTEDPEKGFEELKKLISKEPMPSNTTKLPKKRVTGDPSSATNRRTLPTKRVTTTSGRSLPVKKVTPSNIDCAPNKNKNDTNSRSKRSSNCVSPLPLPLPLPLPPPTKKITNSASNLDKHSAPDKDFDKVFNRRATQDEIETLGNLRKSRGWEEPYTNTILRETDLKNLDYDNPGTPSMQQGKQWTRYISHDKVDYIQMKWDNAGRKWNATPKNDYIRVAVPPGATEVIQHLEAF